MTSYSFPPADDLISYLSKVDYQKLWTVVLFTGAFLYVIFTRLSVWYQNGGKESIGQILIQCRQILSSIILWVFDVAIPGLHNIYKMTQERHNLVTL